MFSRFGGQLKQNEEHRNKAEDLLYLIHNKYIHTSP